MFARAIGDTNSAYADGDAAVASELGAIPAPPTFVTASARLPLRARIVPLTRSHTIRGRSSANSSDG